MRIKFYIYVIPEYRVPWLDIYKYPLPNTCTRWGVSLDILTKWHTVVWNYIDVEFDTHMLKLLR
jgi:hypothetical protein